jgi:glutamine amidotransferase-like uncharacterized protein
MPRLTKLEREAVRQVIQDMLAGDATAFFNGGCEVSDPPTTKDERRALKLADALVSASFKI